ncbi:MAG: hypothetical protein Q8R24_07360 [Legionellaceae bacterium]|nr:hypothetical protein [Legionellaceae bacterium]
MSTNHTEHGSNIRRVQKSHDMQLLLNKSHDVPRQDHAENRTNGTNERAWVKRCIAFFNILLWPIGYLVPKVISTVNWLLGFKNPANTERHTSPEQLEGERNFFATPDMEKRDGELKKLAQALKRQDQMLLEIKHYLLINRLIITILLKLNANNSAQTEARQNSSQTNAQFGQRRSIFANANVVASAGVFHLSKPRQP